MNTGMATKNYDGTSQSKRGRGRPPKPSVLEEHLPCLVGPRASEATRRRVFLETIEKAWTLRRACAAAGITRRQAISWINDDPDFQEAYFLAQAAFCDAVEEALVQAAVGRGGRVLRASMSALQHFLSTHHEDYTRGRMDLVARQMTPLIRNIEAIIRQHCTPDVVDAIRVDLERMEKLHTLSGGAEHK